MIAEPRYYRFQDGVGFEDGVSFIAAHRDPPELLQLADEIFDQATPLVGLAMDVERRLVLGLL